ncbi:MAG: hypothetical protein Q4B68_03270 [Bacteroidales bacterium]|nr:hypothetical protein [Bacteroidales bacterium]
MMKKLLLSLAIVGCCAYASAQDRYYYSGPQLRLAESQFSSEKIADLQGEPKHSYQGMDCWGETVVSLQHKGFATTYRHNGNSLTKIATFKLGSYAETNHANVASFTTQYFAKTDKFPLLFVSQCYKKVVDGQKDVIYVERLANDLKSSKLVAKIHFKDVSGLYGYAVQWVVDRENKFLYGFGNTVENLSADNKHRLVKFKLPTIPTKGKKAATITLSEKDMLENYIIEDYYTGYYKQVGQGLMIKHGYLYMPVGLGTAEHPSLLYVWDLAKRKMQNTIDLSKATAGELEDCAEYMGELLIQTQGEMYQLRFQ